MKRFINFILSLVTIVVFLCAVGCANPNSSSAEADSNEVSTLEAEVMESAEISAARASSLTLTGDIALDGNPGDYAEWTFTMSQAAQKVKVLWYAKGKKSKCIYLVNGKQQGGKKTFGSKTSRKLNLPKGTVTLRVAIDESDKKGGEITFTKVVISSPYASKGGSSSSSSASSEPSSSSSSSSSASSEPASSSSSSSTSSTSGTVITGDTPTIWYASDSTVRHYKKSSSMQQGVGQRLPEFLTAKVSIANYAKGGRAISSFKSDGFWGDILKGVKKGDVILIQFGINDRGDVPDKEDFKNYLRDYTKEARAKGAIPVFVTPTPRVQHKNGVFTNAFTKYCEAKFEVGEELGVTVIDLQTKGRNFYTKIGPDRVKKEMMKDTLHPIKDGAYHLARLLAEGIMESNLSPLKDYVIKDRLGEDAPQTTDGWNPREGYTHN